MKTWRPLKVLLKVPSNSQEAVCYCSCLATGYWLLQFPGYCIIFATGYCSFQAIVSSWLLDTLVVWLLPTCYCSCLAILSSWLLSTVAVWLPGGCWDYPSQGVIMSAGGWKQSAGPHYAVSGTSADIVCDVSSGEGGQWANLGGEFIIHSVKSTTNIHTPTLTTNTSTTNHCNSTTTAKCTTITIISFFLGILASRRPRERISGSNSVEFNPLVNNMG